MEETMAVEQFIFEFEAKVDNIRVVRSAIKVFLKLKKASDSEIFDTELAINEAVANVIEHTYNYREDEIIVIRLFWNQEERSCVFEIQDFGEPVKIEKIASRDLEDVKEHGLGVYLIKSIMDEIKFKKAEKGNLLHLKKHFREKKNA